MIFDRVDIENFMRFEKASLPLHNQGLVLITGDNRDNPAYDSNGSGKSSLLDAIVWCLWGKTIKKLTADQVVNTAIGHSCKVSVHFRDEQHSYLVERYRKHKTHKKPNDLVFYIDGEADEGAGMKLTQERIDSVLGLDFDSFCCMMPGAGIKVAELTDASIKAQLEKILQTEAVSKAQLLVKAELGELKKRSLEISSNIKDINTKISFTNKSILNYKNILSSFEDSKKLKIDKKKQALNSEMRALQELEASYTLNLLNEDSEVILNELKLEYSTKQEASHKRERALGMALASAEVDRGMANERLNALKARMHKTESLSLCGECGQFVDEQHKLSSLKDLQVQYDKLTQELLACDDHKVGLEEDIRELRRATREELVELKKRQIHIEAVVAEERAARSRAHDYAKDKARIAKTIKALETELLDISQERSPVDPELVETLEDELRTLQEELSANVEESTALTESIARHEYWVNGFSHKGVRNYMLQHVVPLLSDLANEYARVLTGGSMKVKFLVERESTGNPNFSIEVDQKDGAPWYNGNSAGERSRADLAIALAFGDLAARRANRKISFRFLDEPFEAVDDSGTEYVLKLLHSQQEKYDTIFCITHKKSFQELFPKSIVVVKENGVSRIEEGE